MGSSRWAGCGPEVIALPNARAITDSALDALATAAGALQSCRLHGWSGVGPSAENRTVSICASLHSYCRRCIAGHSIAAVRALKSSLWATGRKQRAWNQFKND